MKTSLECTLPRECYVSDAYFDRERERIFFREWFCVCRAEEIGEPGDYLHSDVAGESILIVRAKDRSLRAHYNVCRHRGSRLVPVDGPPCPSEPGPSGRFAGAIRCPYHAWTYELDGVLRTAPFLENDALDRGDFHLHPVEIDEWGGFVFVRLSPNATPFTLVDQLGAVPERLARYPLRGLRTARRIAYDVAANWKVILENYNECYHCGPVHPELCGIVPAFKQYGGGRLDWERGIPHKPGAYTFTFDGTTNRAPFPGINDDEKTRHKGELIYPNLLLSLAADHVAALTIWPRDRARTTVICDFLFHPSEIAKPGFDPRDAVEFWDLVNRQDWRICESVQSGMNSRVFDIGYYAPMESASLDIRRYVRERMGES